MKAPLSDGDGTISQFFFEKRVADHMTANVISVSPDTTLREVAQLFDANDFNSFPVLQNGRLIGIFSKFDFMRAFAFTEDHPLPDYQTLMEMPVREFMREELLTARPDMPLTRVLQRMVETRTRSFPVVSEGRLTGVISREDIMRALRESTSATSEFSCRGAQSHLSE
jgi:CBS domain-containing protein